MRPPQAQAALMYDTVTLVAEMFNRMLRKKADTFRVSPARRDGGYSVSNATRGLECNNTAQGVTAWEHGERVAKYVRQKVGHFFFFFYQPVRLSRVVQY